MRRLLLTREIGGPRQPRAEGATRHQNAEKETHDFKRHHTHARGKRATSHLALAHSTPPPLPATPILGVATLEHGGRALIFKTPKNFMHFGTLGTYHFFSRFLTLFNPGPHWSVRSLLTREVGGPRQPRPELPSDLRGAPPGASFVAVSDCGLGSSQCPTPSPPLSNFQERSGTALEV